MSPELIATQPTGNTVYRQQPLISEIPDFNAVSDSSHEIEIESLENPTSSGGAISESAIQASVVHDLAVRERYEITENNLVAVSEHSQSAHAEIVTKAQEAIEVIENEYEQWLEQATKAQEMMIAALHEKFRRNVEKANIERIVTIEDRERIITASENLVENNERAIANLRRTKTDGLREQKLHETRRNTAEVNANQFVAELIKKQSDLEFAYQELEKYKVKLFDAEARNDQLIGEEMELSTEARLEREVLAEPSIRELQNNLDLAEDSTEFPAAVRTVIQNIKADVRSQKLSEILGQMNDIKEKREWNKRHLNNTQSILDGIELSIMSLNERITELPTLIDLELAKHAEEMGQVAQTLERYSLSSEIASSKLTQINKGDTTAVAGSAFPHILRPVWTSMGRLQELLEKTADGKPREWPNPDTDLEIMFPLVQDDEEAHMLSDVSEITRNRDGLNARMAYIASADILGNIGRKVVKQGARIIYHTPKNEGPAED